MKQRKLFFLLFLLLSNNMIFSQALNEKLGGVKTNFIFFSDTVDLEVNNQFLIKSAEKFSDVDYLNTTDHFGYGGSYESYHLEFSTKKFLSVGYVKKPDYEFELSFYDGENKVIETLGYSTVFERYTPNYVKKVTIAGNSEMRFFSFDLINIPISLLEKANKINVKKIIDIKNKDK